MKAKKKNKVIRQLEINRNDEKKIFATTPGKISAVLSILGTIGLVAWIVLELLISGGLLSEDVWEFPKNILDQISWVLVIIGSSIFLTANYFVNKKK